LKSLSNKVSAKAHLSRYRKRQSQ